MDWTIKILPGATLPKLNFYSITPREVDALREFIGKNLATGTRQHLSYFGRRKMVPKFEDIMAFVWRTYNLYL